MDKSGARKKAPRKNSVSDLKNKTPIVVEVVFGLPLSAADAAKPAEAGNSRAPKTSPQRLLFKL